MVGDKQQRSSQYLAWFCALLLLARDVRCQLSAPVASDEHMDTGENKFLQRKAEDDDKQWE
jgi:hypothetical protein